MSKFISKIIDKWDGGIVNDPRNPAENVCRVVSNFNIFENPYKMVPYRDSEDGDSGASTSQKQNFCIALRSGYQIFALGVKSGTGIAEVLMKALTTGASTDLDDNGWSTPTNNQSASGATSFNLFIPYKNKTTGKDFIFGATGGTSIWAFDPTSVGVWNDTALSLTYTNIAQGLVHSRDDILYIPYDNKIAKKNGGTLATDNWTAAALTLPTNLYITSIAEYGNYLAIACAPLSGFGSSIVYLWDRDASLATLSESIDWGNGILKVLEVIDGVLIGISMIGGTFTTFNDRIIFRYLSGNQAVKFQEITGSTSSILLQTKQKINSRLYFMMKISLNGATRAGVWSVGRTPNSPFTIVHERSHINDTALVNGVLKNFFIVDDYTFISYVDESSNYALSKTNDASSYSATSVRETQIFNGGDSSVKKRLVGVTVMTDYLPAAGQVVLKYKKDEETSYTTIFTEATDNSISHSATKIESSGAILPEFKEICFRIESTGGAVITGLKFKAELLDKDIY